MRAYAEAADGLGYRHLVAYDHVLGADRSVHPDWAGPYDLHDTFHEPMVLFGWLAGLCGLEFATGILIGPQRQTALVAKQAAEVDLFGGRLRLGWSRLEPRRVRGARGGLRHPGRPAGRADRAARALWTGEPSASRAGSTP